MTDSVITIEPENNKNLGPKYGGFWIRVVASILDFILFYIFAFALGMVIGIFYIISGNEINIEESDGFGIFDALALLSGMAYYIGFNCSKFMATPGKMAVGLVIINEDGSRISFLKSVGRYFAQILSGIILLIGYIMVAFHPQKRSLHDLMCGTYVVYKRR